MGQYSYHAEPSGTFYRYDAKAIGSGSEGAQAELVNEYHKYVEATTLRNLGCWNANAVAQVFDPLRSRDAYPPHTQAGHGGEARRKERAARQHHKGQGLPDLQ